MSVYINEQAADAAVIQTLVRENKRLRSLIMAEEKKIIISTDGMVYEVGHARVLTLEEIQSRRADAEAEVTIFNKAAEAAAGTDTNVTVSAQPDAPVVNQDGVAQQDVTPVQQPVATPLVDEQPQVVAAPIEAQPVAPVDAGVTPIDPSLPQPPVLS